MSESVSQAVANRSLTLFEKLASNEPLSNLVMGFLGNMIVTCAKRGKSVASIRCGPISESLGDFRFRVEFLPVIVASNGLWQMDNDMQRYVSSKSAHMAKCFDVNPSLVKTFTTLIETIDRWCQHKRIAFKDFKIKKAYVTPNDIFVLRSGTATLDGFKGKGKY